MAWLSAHSLELLLAGACVFTVLWLFKSRQSLRLTLPWAVVLGAGHVLMGVVCVKLFAVLEAGSLSAAGNMSLFGAVFFLPLLYLLGAKLSKTPVGEVFDLFTPPVIVTLAVARVNCLLTGCCLGRSIPGSDLRWPTREAELVFYALLLGWMLTKGRQFPRGARYPLYMTWYGLFRFVTEFFRDNGTPALLHLSHLWAALCFTLGLSFYLQLRTAKPGKESHKKHS